MASSAVGLSPALCGGRGRLSSGLSWSSARCLLTPDCTGGIRVSSQRRGSAQRGCSQLSAGRRAESSGRGTCTRRPLFTSPPPLTHGTLSDEAAPPPSRLPLPPRLPLIASAPQWLAQLRQQLTPALAALVVASACVAPGAEAADALKTCACLLKECRGEFVQCLSDVKCASNIACLQTCNGRPDETECQIGCGDLFENDVVDKFNTCAVSEKHCVPQKGDDQRYPIPPPTALVPEFDISRFKGTWFISSGLNRTFDTFDCQEHVFTPQNSPPAIEGKLNWRIATPDGGFFTRSAVQRFVQDKEKPAILYNHGNEFLHYEDDWYILDEQTTGQPDDFILVYYKGRNDAWDGYGGAVVYTRQRTVPESIAPRLREAAKRAGLDYAKFTATDNSCKPEPPLFARLERTVEGVVERGEQALVAEVQFLEKEVEEVGAEELGLLQKLGQAISRLFGGNAEENIMRTLTPEEQQIMTDLNMSPRDFERLFAKPVPLRKLR